MDNRGAPAKQANRHPVDQLADVRAQIKALQELEAVLKARVSADMGTADSLGGDEFIALQTLTTRKGAIDEKKALKAGVDLDDFRKPETVVHSLRIERREQEAA